jgi:hypothetical protein
MDLDISGRRSAQVVRLSLRHPLLSNTVNHDDPLAHHSKAILTYWLSFLEAFKQFADPDPHATARNKLDKLKQTRSAAEYV